MERLSEMARLLESNEATLSVYDEAAVTATLQHLGRLGYTRRMILATLCRGCSPVSQEKHHRKAFRHTTSLSIQIFASTLYGQP
jgi:hypothetical protein